MRKRPFGEPWTRSKEIAAYAMMGMNSKSITGEATHYHTEYVSPYWRSGLIHTETIGTHIFYRIPRAEEWKIVRKQQAEYRASKRAGVQKASAQTSAKSEPKKDL
jgi:hypothetical protein